MLFVVQAYYPVNYLRNVALNNTITKYVFTNDVDFMPSRSLRQTLEHQLTNGPHQVRHVGLYPLIQDVFLLINDHFQFGTWSVWHSAGVNGAKHWEESQ